MVILFYLITPHLIPYYLILSHFFLSCLILSRLNSTDLIWSDLNFSFLFFSFLLFSFLFFSFLLFSSLLFYFIFFSFLLFSSLFFSSLFFSFLFLRKCSNPIKWTTSGPKIHTVKKEGWRNVDLLEFPRVSDTQYAVLFPLDSPRDLCVCSEHVNIGQQCWYWYWQVLQGVTIQTEK